MRSNPLHLSFLFLHANHLFNCISFWNASVSWSPSFPQPPQRFESGRFLLYWGAEFMYVYTRTRIPICIFGRLEKMIQSFFVCSVVQVEKSCGHWCGVIDSHVNLQMLDKSLQQRCSVYLRNQHLAYAFSFPGTQTLSEHLQSFLSLVIMCFGCPDFVEFPTLKNLFVSPLACFPSSECSLCSLVHWLKTP